MQSRGVIDLGQRVGRLGPAGANFLQQQARFDDFVAEFNAERPHEALEMKCPAEVYTPSSKLIPACRS
jgi:hypothetical protein